MQLSDISWQTVVIVIGAVVLLAGVYTSIMSAIKTARDESDRRNKPMDDIRQMLANDKARLDSHERSIQQLTDRTEEQDKTLRLILKGQLALIRHGIDGNNIQGLKDEQSAIQDHLINK